jgi:CHAT domain-containing protein
MRAPVGPITLAWVIVLVLAPSAAMPGHPAIGEERGVIVEVGPRPSTGETAGLQVGDRLFSWVRRDEAGIVQAEGLLESPFAFRSMDFEQVSRGPVELHGERAGQPRIWLVHDVAAATTHTRPALSEGVLAAYEDGRRLAKAGQVEEAAERWQAIALRAIAEARPTTAAWLIAKTGRNWRAKRNWVRADAAFAEAVRLVRAAGDPVASAHLLVEWSEIASEQQDWDTASARLREALAIADAGLPGAPMERVHVLKKLAGVLDRLDPAEAERLWLQALQIAKRVAPTSYAGVLETMATVKSERGELAAADALAHEAIELRRKLGKSSWLGLWLLALISERRGDLVSAELYSRSVLHLVEEENAAIPTVGMALSNLGYSLVKLGRLDEAESMLQRGLQLASGEFPEVEVAVLENLAILAKARGDRISAERHLVDALAIARRSSTTTVLPARILTYLGQVALDGGRRDVVEGRFREALELLSKLMPGTHLEARALNGLGRAQRAGGQLREAAQTLCRAVDSLDQQSGRLGGAQESRSTFAAEYAEYPRDCVAARVATGEAEAGLRVLERSRASVLLRMLAERHVSFSADLPADMASERSRMDAEYERTQAALGKLAIDREAAERERLLARLLELRDQRAALAARIRQSSPRLASLQYPEPLDLRGVREVLDPGTLYLAYSAGEKETLLFAVEPAGGDGPGLTVHAIPISRAELFGTIENLRGAISRAPSRSSSGPPPAARELYRTLLGPVEPAIARHQRLLISPDGPLHALPFAALWGGNPEGYLVERVPIHVVASATVYAELKKSRRPNAPGDFRVVAFGDPKYPRLPKGEADELRNHELRSAVLRGEVFPALPETRTEVQNIATLFPGRVTTFPGDQAREEKAKVVGKDARYLHFACHGVLNERFPLDSALALSLPKNPKPGEDNGLLQAWEVFDSMRLDAELVTLSACQSGLGKEMGGEGLLGLTRAFQYAGARSVLASLWSVGDESTAKLMTRFYRHLRDGATKDEALRAAQREMIQSQAHPFHWAAFQLSGDWK